MKQEQVVRQVLYCPRKGMFTRLIYPARNDVVEPATDYDKSRRSRETVQRKVGEQFYREQDILSEDWNDSMLELGEAIPAPTGLKLGKDRTMKGTITKPMPRIKDTTKTRKEANREHEAKEKEEAMKYTGGLWD